jgi:hypothetical protein
LERYPTPGPSLLEKNLSDEERIIQTGNVGLLKPIKNLYFYDGDTFPFKHKEFDYVICSHVEHVPIEQLPVFLNEFMRVSARGHIEFPTLYYECYDIEPHQTLVF